MTKLTYEDKINIYNKRKKGIGVVQLSKMYKVNRSYIYYLENLIDKHGKEIINIGNNKKYSINDKERIINRVLLDGETITSVAIDEGLSNFGMLSTWIKNYKKMGYNIVERKRGRSPTMQKKDLKPKTKETIEEKVKRLEEENLYLKVELEYSKKLRAVVQARKNQQQKKK